MSIHLLIHFFILLFHCSNFIQNTELHRWICLFDFLFSYFIVTTSYEIWTLSNRFAYSTSYLHVYVFSFLSFPFVCTFSTMYRRTTSTDSVTRSSSRSTHRRIHIRVTRTSFAFLTPFYTIYEAKSTVLLNRLCIFICFFFFFATSY